MATEDRFRRHAVMPEEAQQTLLRYALPLDAETIVLGDAWGRYAAETIVAPHPYPTFRRSGMDGYAVRAADLQAADRPMPDGAMLRVMESLPAGTVPKRVIGPGQASRIMTGGMLPGGADTVVMLEMAETFEQEGKPFVRIRKSVQQGRNVSEVGSELSVGDALVAAGRRIGPGETALLAAFGLTHVPVMRKPRIGVISTGSELLDVHEALAPARIRNSNSPMLHGLLRDAGAEPVILGKVPDQTDDAEAVVREALQSCDMLITTGGVSVGDHDIMVDILARWEGKTLFNKIAMRPGSPTTAAVLDGKLLLALSGNPGACFVGFHLFAAPVIRAMQRHPRPLPERVQVRLVEPFKKINAYTRYVRSSMEFRDGQAWARLTGIDQSSLMKTIAGANCLLVIPPLKESLPAGSIVGALPLAGPLA